MTVALLWLALTLPAVAAGLVRFSRVGPRTAVAASLLAAAPSWVLLILAAGGTDADSSFVWLPAAGLEVGLQLDGLSAAMAATVATTGVVVIVYALGYFEAGERRRSAITGLLAFLAAMQGLVLADGYLTMLIFWELVGAASFRMIALSRDDPAAPPAAVRAFLTTRSADLGFYIAVLALFTASGTLDFTSERPEGLLGAAVAAGLILAAVGKSAQIPLQTWLSAAMAGPTPVSALLHSATMVAAGVYLLIRSYDLLAGLPLEIVGWVGAVTAVLAAGIAVAQKDLKRILAGSTTSQLGLMFVGLAAGGPAVALFQLVTHAAGKAGLFLAAGIFQHNRGTTSLSGLRGAGREDPVALAGFLICALSIAAVPPMAVFWSKEHIVASAEKANEFWFVLVLVAGAGAAAYLLRPLLVLWRGERSDEIARGGRRPMLVGLMLMVSGSLSLGLIGGPLAALIAAPELPGSRLSLLLSLGAVTLGILAVLIHRRPPFRVSEVFRTQFGIDEGIDRLIRRPLFASARALDFVDRYWIDAAVDGIGRGTLVAARAQQWIDRRIIDTTVDGLARRVGRGGDELGRVQSGLLYEYFRDAVIGAAAIAFLIALAALL